MKYALALSICLMCSCDRIKVLDVLPEIKNDIPYAYTHPETWVDQHRAQVVVIDSCEYIKSYTAAGGNVYTHKGNCKHCRKQLFEDIESIIEKINERR